MFCTTSHISTTSPTVLSFAVHSTTASLNGALYLLVAIDPSAICESSSFSTSSPVAPASKTHKPFFLNSLKAKFWSSQSRSICSRRVSTCASLPAPPVSSSISSTCGSRFASSRSPSLNESSAMSSSAPKSAMSACQWRGRIAGDASDCTIGKISRKSSIFLRRSVYASQSRSALGSLRQAAWKMDTCSFMDSMFATTSVHKMSA